MAEASHMFNPTLLVWILVAVVLAFLLFLAKKSFHHQRLRRENRSSPPALKEKRTAHDRTTPTPSSQALAQRMIFDETGMVIPELSITEPSSEELRKRMEQAVESIFPSKLVESSKGKPFAKADTLGSSLQKTLAQHIDHLKNFSATCELTKTLDDPNVNMAELSKIIVADPILTGKIIKIANSAYFGMQKKVNSIGHALMIIGLLNIKTFLMQDGLLKLLRSKSAMENFLIDSLWEHATLTSICAAHLQSLFGGLDRGTLFTLGLLHDIGKFVMHDLSPLNPNPRVLAVSPTEFTMYDEEKAYGVNHAAMGRLLFDQWGFPEPMGRIIERHHDPFLAQFDPKALDSKELKYLLVLFLSNQIAKVFASEDKSVMAISPLSPECQPFVQRQRFLGLVLDGSLFAEIKKAKSLARSK